MNKNILAIAIAAAVAAPSAFAAATVYGNAHMSIDSVQDVAGAGGAKASQTNVASNSSFIGIKGSEDLGAGLKAVYQYETTIGLDGEVKDSSGTDRFKGEQGAIGELRNSFVGLGGGFGTVLLGRHDSPIKMVGRKYDMFGDQIGNNRMVLSGNGITDGRHSNVMAYSTPTFGGVKALFAYTSNAGSANESFSNDAVKKDAFTFNVGYEAKGFTVDAGYINVAKSVNNDKGANAYRLGAGYTFGAAKIMALYQNAEENVSNNAKGRNGFGVGGSYKITTAGTIKAQVFGVESNAATNAPKNGAMMYSVGYDHALSKSTTAYVAYSMIDNDADATFSTVAGGGHGDSVVGVRGKDNSAFSVGVQHKF